MRTDLYTRTLRDVDATLPADGEVLAWDVDLGKYVPTEVDALVTPAPPVDLTDIVILDHTANAFRVREGSNNYIHVNTTNGSESLALGNATTNPSFSLLGTGALLWNAARQITLPDNTANVIRLMEGSNEYFGVSTTNGSEAVRFGNTNTNPSFAFSGSGALTLPTGHITIPDNTATAFRVRESANNYLAITTTNGSEAITLGNASTNPDLVWLGSGPWSVGGGTGTSGYVLTSNGASASPSWQPAASGFDPENVLISPTSATALRIHDGTQNWLLFDADSGTIDIGNDTDNPDVWVRGSGLFVVEGRFAVMFTEVVSAVDLILGRGRLAATPQDGTLLAESGAGAHVTGGSLNIMSGAGTGDGGSGEIRMYNSIPAAGAEDAQDQRPTVIVNREAHLFRTHGAATDDALGRYQATNRHTWYHEFVAVQVAVENPPLPDPELVGYIWLPEDFTGYLRAEFAGIEHFVGYDPTEGGYALATLVGESRLHLRFSGGVPLFLGGWPYFTHGGEDYYVIPRSDFITGATSDYEWGAARQSTYLVANYNGAQKGRLGIYAYGASGTIGSTEVTGNILLDVKWHALAYEVGESTGGTPPTITSFTVDVTGAGSPGGTASCRAGVETLDFAWAATGDPTITYSIDQGVGAVSGGSETGVASVEGVTVYTLTATNAYGNDTATVTVTGVRQAITRYTWRWSYWGSDLSGTNIPSRGTANGDVIDADTLTRSGAAPTTGISTSGFASLALPAALVNNMWRPGGTANGDAYADPTGNNSTGASLSETCHHVRWVGATIGSITNGRRFWGLRATNTDSVHMLWVGAGSILRFTLTRGGSATNFDVSSGLTTNSAYLVDFIYDDAGGSGGHARVIVRINGVEVLNTASGGTADYGAGTLSVNGNLGWGCQPGNTNVQDAQHVSIHGRNLSAYTDFTLADHQADAEALGLYTP